MLFNFLNAEFKPEAKSAEVLIANQPVLQISVASLLTFHLTY